MNRLYYKTWTFATISFGHSVYIPVEGEEKDNNRGEDSQNHS